VESLTLKGKWVGTSKEEKERPERRISIGALPMVIGGDEPKGVK